MTTTADTLRTAVAAMLRDGGDETAPTWARYVAALGEHDAATAALHAAVTGRWDDVAHLATAEDAADCAYCGGDGGSGVVICGHCTD
jgi:hypothetical protein